MNYYFCGGASLDGGGVSIGAGCTCVPLFGEIGVTVVRVGGEEGSLRLMW